MFSFRAKAVLQAVVHVANVRLGIESGQGAKIIAAIGEIHEVVQLSSIALHREFRGLSRLVGAGGEKSGVGNVKRGGEHSLETGSPVAIQPEAAVNTAHAVEIARQFAVGVHRADI